MTNKGNSLSTAELKKIRSQFLEDTFKELNVSFERKKKILDVGCGDGCFSDVFANQYGLTTYSGDIFKDKNIRKIKNINFRIESIYDLKYKNEFFDYVFLHDVLHHIDEEKQSYLKHKSAIKELQRITKKGGTIIIVEANRYNLLFYPHMVRMNGHNHWKQSYFEKIMHDTFPKRNYTTRFVFFELHVYTWWRNFWKLYEKLANALLVKPFAAYNVLVATKKK